jgi:endonuclease/exonuclease/phosphatase family metal-dependent hydrolase
LNELKKLKYQKGDSVMNNSVRNMNTGSIGKSKTESISVMSFNILTRLNDPERSGRVVKMINKYKPDVLGIQEASEQLMDILTNSNLSDNYAILGEGRNGGKTGEYSAVFYLKDKFTVIESATKWLSSTPDVPNSKIEISKHPRIMTYAVLERNSDGMRFLFTNTHLEHTSVEARSFQLGVLVKELAKFPDLPTIVTGDFNCEDTEDTYKVITESGFSDAAKEAAISNADGLGTFISTNARIDFILGSNGNVSFESYEVCTGKIDGNYASDHHPIYAIVNIVK